MGRQINKFGERKMGNGQKTEEMIFSEDDILLFTTSTCPKCSSVKKWLTDKNIKFKLIVADENEDNMKLAESFDIQCVPAIVKNFEVYSFESFKKGFE